MLTSYISLGLYRFHQSENETLNIETFLRRDGRYIEIKNIGTSRTIAFTV